MKFCYSKNINGSNENIGWTIEHSFISTTRVGLVNSFEDLVTFLFL